VILHLDRPFPLIEEPKHKILASFFFGLFVFLFLLIFKPFGITNLEHDITLFVLGYGGITFGVLLFTFFVPPLVFKTFFLPGQWTVKKMVIFTMLHLVTISVLNWYYSMQFDGNAQENISLPMFILITISIGIFPGFLMVYFVEKYLSKRNELVANSISDRIYELKPTYQSDLVNVLSSDNGKDSIPITIDQLICIKAEGNYVMVYYLKEDKVKNQLVRNSLGNLYKQLESFEMVKHCHRSFVINFFHVDKVSGNARNYTLHSSLLDFTIPVSRSFSHDFVRSVSAKS